GNPGGGADRRMREDWFRLPLRDDVTGEAVFDRAAAERPRALADEDLAHLSALLKTRPNVDRVTGDEELWGIASARHGLPGVHADAYGESDPELRLEFRGRSAHCERASHCALRIILM